MTDARESRCDGCAAAWEHRDEGGKWCSSCFVPRLEARLAQAGHEHPTVREVREDGALCALCGGGAYPAWLTDDETWQSVMGDSHDQVCLPCFKDRTDRSVTVLYVSLLPDGVMARLRRAERALEAIEQNALSWHCDDEAKGRALGVIAQWARDPSSIPEGIKTNNREGVKR
jgi:hypothetical protein